LVNDTRQGLIICDDYQSVLTWTRSSGTNVMKKHSSGCLKAKEPTPETQPCITSLFEGTSQVTSKQLGFFKKISSWRC
jgi:hypothetical protein